MFINFYAHPVKQEAMPFLGNSRLYEGSWQLAGPSSDYPNDVNDWHTCQGLQLMFACWVWMLCVYRACCSWDEHYSSSTTLCSNINNNLFTIYFSLLYPVLPVLNSEYWEGIVLPAEVNIQLLLCRKALAYHRNIGHFSYLYSHGYTEWSRVCSFDFQPCQSCYGFIVAA